ncbi:MAG TPA: 16S rRNA (guanine(527)-N(7))-methyltransferase RsmG [Rhodothermia bacterium]|nr:16S rRNA (guanine(527)-N(7))-methyltransferase RsmG [Rhodothermia bacterium]
MNIEDQSISEPDVWDPFEGWTARQLELIDAYEQILARANRDLNLVSRASAHDIRRRHIIHSLTIAARDIPAGSSVVDWGTGGGLPGIPLAIRFPDATFHLVDSVLKKTRAVESFCRELGLQNTVVHRLRAEDWTIPVDYAVSRATASLLTLWRWTDPVLKDGATPGQGAWPSGLIALKGGDLREEIADLRRSCGNVSVEQIALEEITGRGEMEGKLVVVVERRTSNVGPTFRSDPRGYA